jgi:hypothetical protein
MHLGTHAQVRSTDVAVNSDRAVTLPLGRPDEFSRGEIFQSIDEDVWMGVSEDERTELHDADETGEVHDFGVGISSI